MTRRKKTVLILLSIFPGLPLLLIAAALAIRGCDEPPPADEDLKVKRIEVPDDQNGYTYLLRAIAKLDMPASKTAMPGTAEKEEGAEDEDPAKERKLLWAITAGVRWDGPFVEKVLRRKAQALALWDRALTAPHFQALAVRSPEHPIPEGLNFLAIARLVQLRARAAAKRGDYETAFQDAMKLVCFGHAVEGSKGGITHYQLGQSVKQEGLALMQELVGESRMGAASLRQLASDLAKYQADNGGLADALRLEYAIEVQVIDGITSGKFNCASPSRITPGSTTAAGAGGLVVGRVLATLSFRPYATQQACAEETRSMIGDMSLYFKDAPRVDPPVNEPSLACEVLSGNLVGRTIARRSVASTESRCILAHKCLENTYVAATRILLALKAYKLEKGKLPATLAELVPDYLDSVPLDDYDGRPMRYNAAKKVVYSVGKDLKDDGGSATRAEYVAVKRREAEAAGRGWTDEDQKDAEQEFYEWDQPDACFEIKF